MCKLIWTLGLMALLSNSLRAGIFTENHYIYCGAILELGPVGYPTWNPASIVTPPEHGNVFILTEEFFPDSLVYKSDYGYLGVDTFVVACAHATQISCDTGIYIIHVIGCPPITAFTETHDISCDSTLLVPGLGYPFWVSPEIIRPPANGQAFILNDNKLDKDSLLYVPSPGFNGSDTVIVECAHATQITCETGIYIINVSCTNSSRDIGQGLSLRIFPNPARGYLLLECSLPLEEVEVVNSVGAPVRQIRAEPPFQRLEINLMGLSPGWYVVRARSGVAWGSLGFVVQH